MLGCCSCAVFTTLESGHDAASASALASLCQASAPGAAQAIDFQVMLSFEGPWPDSALPAARRTLFLRAADIL